MYNTVQEIIKSYPHDAERAKNYFLLDEGSEFFEALYEHYKYDMPTNIKELRGGNPTEWIEDELRRIGFFDYEQRH
jgi:hypothetical protein